MKSTVKLSPQNIYRIALCAVFLTVLFCTRLETARIAPVAAVLVLGIGVGLVVCKRSRYLTLPFLLLSLLLIFCYDSFDVFVRFWPLIIPLVAALAWHLVRLRPKFRIGSSFLPLCAVALATVLGGIGVVPAEQYFAPMALYYTAGLGPVLVVFYLILQNEAGEGQEREVAKREFLYDLAAFGMTAAAVVIGYRLIHLADWIALGTLPYIQWSNNVATMLLFSMPAVFVLAKRNLAFLGAGAAMLAASVLSDSRAGIWLASGLTVVCLLWLYFSEPRENVVRRTWIHYALMLSGFYVLAMASLVLTGWFARVLPTSGEVRFALFRRGFEDLASSPIFGKGLCYTGNADLYSTKAGGMNWYHMFLPQVAGSLGLCGILAWGWQLFVRGRLALQALKSEKFVFALCYLGLFLMTQVNPGEFCPIPYAFCAIFFMVALEGEPKTPVCNKLKNERSRINRD